MSRSSPRNNRSARTARPLEQRVWRESSIDGLPVMQATYLDHQFAWHAQETYVISTNLSGLGACVKSGAYSEPGMFTVIPPGRFHGGERVGDSPWEYVAAYPSEELLQQLHRESTGLAKSRPSFSASFYVDHPLVQQFVHAHRALLSAEEPLAAEAAMLETLATFLERYSRPRLTPRRLGKERARVARAMEFIDANLCGHLTLDEIAAEGGLSRFHFLRVFRNETGFTPFAYLMRRRVERARTLIRAGRPISEAAYDAGFADPAHLNRRFKQVLGVTPGEYLSGQKTAG